MGIQTESLTNRPANPLLDPAADSLLVYYQSFDDGADGWKKEQAAVDVCEQLSPLLLSTAIRLVRRRTCLRGNAAVQAAEDVSQLVLSNLLTRVQKGSTKRRYDPAKRDLAAYVWVLVDRAIISGICRRRLPASFSSLELPAGELVCNRNGSPAEVLEFRDQSMELRLAIQLLPDLTRIVMSRVYLEGEGKKKVAQSLKRSPSFITREIARGLALMKRILRHLRQTGKRPRRSSGGFPSCGLEA